MTDDETEGLPTAAIFTLNPKYEQGIIWERDGDELEEGDELVRRKDIKNFGKPHNDFTEGYKQALSDLLEEVEASE